MKIVRNQCKIPAPVYNALYAKFYNESKLNLEDANFIDFPEMQVAMKSVLN